MKHYIVTAYSLRIREAASAHSSVPILGSLPRNAKFYSDKQIEHNNGELWAQRLDDFGRPAGWMQIHNVKNWNCKELPMPVPPAFLPDPALPPIAPSPNTDALMARIERIESDIRLLMSLVNMSR